MMMVGMRYLMMMSVDNRGVKMAVRPREFDSWWLLLSRMLLNQYYLLHLFSWSASFYFGSPFISWQSIPSRKVSWETEHPYRNGLRLHTLKMVSGWERKTGGERNQVISYLQGSSEGLIACCHQLNACKNSTTTLSVSLFVFFTWTHHRMLTTFCQFLYF